MKFNRKNWRKQQAQKKRDLYLQGLMDARRGWPMRWLKHPCMRDYKRGHGHGEKWFPRAERASAVKKRGSRLLSALERWIGRRPSK